MFTGLVENTGILHERANGKIRITPRRKFTDLKCGDSIAVNGCCLTLEREISGDLEFHTLSETLRRTNLAAIPKGGTVNLERALCLGDRLAGHIVQGHVDAALAVRKCSCQVDGDIQFEVELPEKYAALVVLKGSIAIDGVSLTVAVLEKEYFAVRLIPQTLNDTALLSRKPGDLVNIEFDIIGRYILRSMELERENKKTEITMETLRDAGFF